MKQTNLFFLFTLLMNVIGVVNANAYDIAVENADGVTIYYSYINDGKELKVVSGSYSGVVVIPEEVTIMNRTRKVTSIGDDAFIDCTGLSYVTIPNSVKYIGEKAFCRCGLTSITIPESVRSTGDRVFSGCAIKTITILGSPYFGRESFEGCGKLTAVHISNLDSFLRIEYDDMFLLDNSPLNFAHHLYLNGVEIKDLEIPNTITKINGQALSGLSSLTSVTIPNSVTSIGSSAFFRCSSLTSVTIPNSVTSLGGYAFFECSGLTSVKIPNSVTSIEECAFEGCSGLTSVTIPNSVTSIGMSAFYGCSGLTSVTIPNSVTSIGDWAFRKCSGLTSVTIPNSVTSIGRNAFSGCDLPEVISKIENPFKIYGKSTEYETFSFNTFYNATLYVPVGTIDKYKATEGWKDFVFIEEENGGGETPPETKKCEKPTISYSNGKLTFSCATEDVTYQYNITASDVKSGAGNDIDITPKYTITVYATKADYVDSDTATAEIEVPGELKGDLNNDGKVDVTDHVKLSEIIMNE